MQPQHSSLPEPQPTAVPAPASLVEPTQASTAAAPVQPAAVNQTGPLPSGQAPAVADDGDRIEADWVHKVKQIMGATRHDPFEQSRQFTQLKTEYLQKRYGKTIQSE